VYTSTNETFASETAIWKPCGYAMMSYAYMLGTVWHFRVALRASQERER
jgi:hypothetical protein